MIKLFKYEGYKVTVEPEAILLLPFKRIWERDKSPNKSLAMQELGFIYFMCDPRSDYQFLIDEEMRKEEVKKGEGMNPKWEPDDLVKSAMAFYNSFVPISSGLLEDTKNAVEKLRKLLREINLDERDEKGRPIYTLSSITQTIKQVPDLARSLDAAERALSRDIMADSKARGSQVKALYEDED